MERDEEKQRETNRIKHSVCTCFGSHPPRQPEQGPRRGSVGSRAEKGPRRGRESPRPHSQISSHTNSAPACVCSSRARPACVNFVSFPLQRTASSFVVPLGFVRVTLQVHNKRHASGVAALCFRRQTQPPNHTARTEVQRWPPKTGSGCKLGVPTTIVARLHCDTHTSQR